MQMVFQANFFTSFNMVLKLIQVDKISSLNKDWMINWMRNGRSKADGPATFYVIPLVWKWANVSYNKSLRYKLEMHPSFSLIFFPN